MSTDSQSNNKRIAKNTLFLYFRMFLTMLVGFYTSRVVLHTLGQSDYGLYNVVGGFITMLAFINTSMATGTQRFLSFEIGNGDEERLKLVFTNSITIHLVIALIIMLISETLGLWFVERQMNIPEGRENAAFWIYQFSIITFIISIIQVPLVSTIIAHEKMDVYAYMSIYDVSMKLLIVYLLKIAPFDKVILYASLICIVQVTSAFLYCFYAIKHFKECKLRIGKDKKMIKELTGFSTWTLIGTLGYTTNGQGINVILNIFFGTIVNAARGIAFQVNNIIVGFSRSFQVAANPQIIKLYSEGKIDEMSKLANLTSKFSAYFLLIIMLPIIVDAEFFLSLWLGEYPYYTPIFIRIIMIQSLIQSMSSPIVTVTHAGGRLKMPNLTGGLCIISALPVSYVALTLGCTPTQVLILNFYPWIFECFFDALYAQKYTGFSLKNFYIDVYFRVLLVTSICLIFMFFLRDIIEGAYFIQVLYRSSISVLITLFVISFIGLSKSERTIVVSIIKKKILRK